MLSPHLVLPVKTRIIFQSLNEICKQATPRNVELNNGCRENTAIRPWMPLWERFIEP